MKNSDQNNNIALFIDFENLIRSALDIALPIDIAPIINKLLEYGRILIRRGFGDLDAACSGDGHLRKQIRRMIQENLIQFEDIAYVSRYKNTADMRLAVEALTAAHAYPDINYFAIVSADRDYVPVISKLRELGRSIIGIGISPDMTNDIYIRSCDVFLYYSSLFVANREPVSSGSDRLDESLIESYVQLLLQAISALNQKGSRPVAAALAPLMRQLRPDFDPKLANLNTFRDLVKIAEDRGLVKIAPYGGDIQISLEDKAFKIIEKETAKQQIDSSDTIKAKSLYINFLEEKMKCQIPPLSIRKQIYEFAVKKIDERKSLSGTLIDLSILSSNIADQMSLSGQIINQASAFKILYALYRAYAFEAEWSEQIFNPRIKGIKVDPKIWDELFIRNCLLVLRRERRGWPLLLGPLAEIFESKPEKIQEIIAQIDEG